MEKLTAKQEDYILQEVKDKVKCIDCGDKYSVTLMTPTEDKDSLICDECKFKYCDCGREKNSEEVVCRECM